MNDAPRESTECSGCYLDKQCGTLIALKSLGSPFIYSVGLTGRILVGCGLMGLVLNFVSPGFLMNQSGNEKSFTVTQNKKIKNRDEQTEKQI